MVQALAKELAFRKNELSEKVGTIYFGGGTPSLLTAEELQFLIDTVYKNYEVIDNPEVTLEANPDDLTKDKIQELSISPVNRLSIGIQSFFDKDLQWMNRAHTAIEARQCLVNATRYFENITLDLIYGIPKMSIARWKENLSIFFGYDIKHLSAYALTVEPKTALAAFIKMGKSAPVSDDLARKHFDILVEDMGKNGFVHYETSNFGKLGYFSKHNTAYWFGKPYLGVGPSAHSFDGGHRSWNIANNAKYLSAIAKNVLPRTVELLSNKDRFNETIMTGLRTIWGINLDDIESRFGSAYKNQLVHNVEKFIKNGLLENDGNNTIKTSAKGKFLADGIASDLFMI